MLPKYAQGGGANDVHLYMDFNKFATEFYGDRYIYYVSYVVCKTHFLGEQLNKCLTFKQNNRTVLGSGIYYCLLWIGKFYL